MTIRKGEPWGSVGPLPPATVRVRSDAEVRGVIAAGMKDFEGLVYHLVLEENR